MITTEQAMTRQPARQRFVDIAQLLDRRELVKLRFDDVEGAGRKELAEILDAHCEAVVGRTALYYRSNLELPRENRVL